MKKTMTILAIAGLILALAPAAQAALVISNPSFESPDQGGSTSSADPTDWTCDAGIGGGDAIFVEGRWTPGAPGADNAGPTDGIQSLVFDKRPGAYTASVEQIVGTVADVGAPTLRLTFDARLGAAPSGEDTENVNTLFKAYLLINGSEEATWTTNLGSLAEGRLIPTYGEQVAAGLVAADPDTDPDNMGNFLLDLDLSSYAGTDQVAVGFRYEAQDDGIGTYSSRVFMDNVAVQGIPEPATMSVLAIGGIALLRRKRR